ncbi:hypothetical protein HZS_3311 [Henneguya salminicola]|nr:hypothetical protein HZS_3311 [Henneguya salminicola]
MQINIIKEEGIDETWQIFYALSSNGIKNLELFAKIQEICAKHRKLIAQNHWIKRIKNGRRLKFNGCSN